jgi:hypothetical protein
MRARLAYLRRRRELLVARAAAQRTEFTVSTLGLQHHLRFVDMGIALVQIMRKHSALSIASATLLLPSPRNKLLLWASRLFTSWQVFALLRRQWRNTG